MQQYKNLILFLCFITFIAISPAFAKDCQLKDRTCVIAILQNTTEQIENERWRDQTYREIAKTLAFEGKTDAAIALIDKIKTPDTKAMTIRGIGMAVTDIHLSSEEYTDIFTKLRAMAEKIEHKPSYAIALTYIAMSQAFAGDDEGAWKTAADMNNDSLRNKAYGETAEIQAERENAKAAMKSIAFIKSAAFRNKAYSIITKILADRNKLEEAFTSAKLITNAYKKAQALQYILDKQKPREVKKK
ncbi:MAG: hypothetical protein KAJ86_04455 [Alphaproteobacteria bacterium]|nr:hypothetical protein [Alphaproteobacteria bacterium]